MSDRLVPAGWLRGEPVQIEKRDNKLVVSVTSVISYEHGEDLCPNDIAYIWFYSSKALSSWLIWWFN
jgi:hypothetical protein